MPELANFITIANRFWQQVRANRLGVDPALDPAAKD